MKLASLEHFGISPLRILGVGVAAFAFASLATSVVLGDSLGQARPAASLLVGGLTCYIVVSTPRRILDRQRVSQAREATVLSASAMGCLTVTGSRPRTLVLLRSRDPALADTLREAGRRVLLGTRVERAVEGSAQGLVSYSAVAAVRGLASFSPGAIEQGDEESRGLESSSDLSRETKVPMLMTVSFFAPILLVLYAVFSHSYDPVRLGELVAFEFIVVDLALYLAAAERNPR